MRINEKYCELQERSYNNTRKPLTYFFLSEPQLNKIMLRQTALKHQEMCIRVVKIRNPRIMKILVMSSQIFRTHSTFLMVWAPAQVSMIMVQYISILSSPNSRFFTTPATCRAGLCKFLNSYCGTNSQTKVFISSEVTMLWMICK